MKIRKKSSIVPFLSKQFIPFLFSYRCNNISSCFRIICALIENSFWRCIMKKKTSTRLLYVGLYVALTPDIFSRVHLHFSKTKRKSTLHKFIVLTLKVTAQNLKFISGIVDLCASPKCAQKLRMQMGLFKYCHK